jgi:tetratricopeptide (TPR) repeat protein
MQEARYKAFISYSHRDDKWAAWLHRALESYKPPKKLVGQVTGHGPVPPRLAPVFRDREELPTATDLGKVINSALMDSQTQVVVCSPAAAQSKWVNEEILAFKRLGRADRIFCLIVDGEPNASDMPGREHEECFPPALRYTLDEKGELSDERTEPIAADARENKDGKGSAKVKLIAGMLGVGFDALAQREAHRRQRRMAVIAAASIVGMVITTGLSVAALLARSEAIEQRARAETEAETSRRTTEFMVDLFSVSDPSEARGNTITAREILDKGADRVEEELADQPAIQATLMETMGKVYTSLGLYDPAVSLLQSSLDERRDLYGDEHLEVAQSLDRLAEVLKLKAEYPEAEGMYRRALAIREELLGEEHPDVARILYQLGDLLSLMGKFQDAEPLLRDAVAIQRRALGDNSSEAVKSLEGLAFIFYRQGKFKDAMSILREAVAMRRELYGGPHPDLAEAINNLGVLLDEAGEYQEAELLKREALDMWRVLYGGEAHPSTALGLNNLAFALLNEGKFDEAESMYREAIAMQRELLGEEHPDVALALNNLALALGAKGDLARAIARARESLAMYRRTVGDEHQAVAGGMANLGMFLTENGEYASAEPLLRDSLALSVKLRGDENTDNTDNTDIEVASSMTLLACLLIETGRYEEARDLASEAKTIREAALGEDHWKTAASASAEGAALAGLGEYDEAEALLSDSVNVLQRERAALPYYVRSATRWLAGLYTTLGRPNEAAEFSAMLSDNGSTEISDR